MLSQKEAVSSIENTVIFEAVDKLISSTKIEKALRILDGAIQCQAASVPFYQKKSQILIQEGYVENAIAVLKDAYSIDAQNLDIIMDVLDAYQKASNFKEALRFIDECLEKDLQGMEIELLLQKVSLLKYLNRTDQAFDILTHLLFDHSNDIDVIAQFSELVRSDRRQVEAIQVLENVLDANPYSERAWFALGHQYYHQCKFPEARMAYEYAFIIEPSFESAYDHFVSVCMDTKSYKKALKVYAEMIERFKLNVDQYIQIAICYHHLKDYERAIKFLEFAMRQDGTRAEVYYHLAKAYHAKGLATFSVNYINKAARLDADNEIYLLFKAQIMLQNQKIDDAVKVFESAVRIDPIVSEVWEGFIKSLILEGHTELALDILAKAKVASGSTLFAYFEAACYFSSNDRSAGHDVLVDALQSAPEQHEVLFELVPSLSKDRKVKDMIAYYLFED